MKPLIGLPGLWGPHQASWGLDCRSTFSGTLSSQELGSPNPRLLAMPTGPPWKAEGMGPLPGSQAMGTPKPRAGQDRPAGYFLEHS